MSWGRLKEARERAGVPLAEAARKMGVSPAWLAGREALGEVEAWFWSVHIYRSLGIL